MSDLAPAHPGPATQNLAAGDLWIVLDHRFESGAARNDWRIYVDICPTDSRDPGRDGPRSETWPVAMNIFDILNPKYKNTKWTVRHAHNGLVHYHNPRGETLELGPRLATCPAGRVVIEDYQYKAMLFRRNSK